LKKALLGVVCIAVVISASLFAGCGHEFLTLEFYRAQLEAEFNLRLDITGETGSSILSTDGELYKWVYRPAEGEEVETIGNLDEEGIVTRIFLELKTGLPKLLDDKWYNIKNKGGLRHYLIKPQMREQFFTETNTELADFSMTQDKAGKICIKQTDETEGETVLTITFGRQTITQN
jgi:hypothetical protein